MSDAAADPQSRRTLLVRRVMAHRGQRDELVLHAARDAAGCERTLRYSDRVLEFHLEDAEREQLEALLEEYPVFKIRQPETRKSDGSVYVAAVADPKHLADFIEDCCRRVYDLPSGYRLRVE
ncbi:hypothetical protein [Halosegnis sp.]|uniref:hypothetical protein n=1 Tax=Halosegnis sp. TaxID=2864959 RepID=UPI0035D4B36E